MLTQLLHSGHTQILFAATASVLVGTYAIYAKHSGIPEIKTVLGGFVIRRFMGAQTLIIKSLGLVSTYLHRTFSLTHQLSLSLVPHSNI